MEGVHSKTDLPRHQLLDLIPNKWMVRDRGGGGGGADHVSRNGYSSVEKVLELRLGLPGEGDDDLSSAASSSSRDRKNMSGDPPSSFLSLGLFSGKHTAGGNPSAGAKRGFLDTLEDSKRQADLQPHKAGFFGPAVVIKEEAGTASAAHKAGDSDGSAEKQQHRASANAAAGNNTRSAETTSFATQYRPSQPPVVGWPPIRSFRKNNKSCSKPSSSPPPENAAAEKPAVGDNKSMLVKINMDGVPIGRKVDLSACSGYDRLSTAVDQLFRGLLAAQRVVIKDHGCSSTNSASSSSAAEQQPAITGLLDGSGEYTLVYEDNEGDRVLVGDVPWEMFVSTVKRLRVLKSSELPSSLSVGVAAAGARRMQPARDSLPATVVEPKRASA